MGLELDRAQARRITLAAQGFADRRHATPTLRTFSRTLARTGVLQIDSVNVLQRAHYMPLYSRMGPYDTALLRRAAEQAPRRIVEYWAHVAAFMPVDLWPHMQHRMRHFRERGHQWGAMRHDPKLVASLIDEVRERGPSTARDLDDGLPRAKTHWGWNWSASKKALEYLFATGALAVAGRNSAFERRYDLPERVIPPQVLARPVPADADAHVELVRRASISHGIATEACLRDYYRMHHSQSRPAVAALVDAGELLPARVEGWNRPAFLHRDARMPRRIAARALLSPFDPVVWERERTERLFGFRYRIEIYVPEHLRSHGYYVLPFLLGDRLVARVDLKADRRAGALVVRSAHVEPQAPEATAAELAAELRQLAGWLGLSRLRVARRGGLARALGAEVAAGG
ncbi:crosslink repair DNA glycosylase YcaQ family protein [Luteimonas sp. M1R5S18]|uniref:Crosslink repair DNA glycosylase YcaQ family protein n=1 Tax=Luteimonas rhizosphaericola TaxID=3042024 RepID=A0ABT6JMY8_9GAMM|nr:crosslink repair DNA glycosylase YcaQ family protein [Luteimonas rhizosphaericola]MDH5832044.1 crosslink repair DNA glycosylase YcaQ family protein [Luteimonas rhizosphaericola]